MSAMLDRWFLAHPRSVNESYPEHAAIALRVAARMMGAGLAAMVHGVFPCLFETTASRTIKTLHNEIAARSAIT
jgi:hypothetical protein